MQGIRRKVVQTKCIHQKGQVNDHFLYQRFLAFTLLIATEQNKGLRTTHHSNGQNQEAQSRPKVHHRIQRKFR